MEKMMETRYTPASLKLVEGRKGPDRPPALERTQKPRLTALETGWKRP